MEARHGSHDAPCCAGPIPRALQLEAVARLIASRAGSNVLEHARAFIEHARAQGIDLSMLQGTVSQTPAGAVVRQACLPVIGAGRTAMVFLSGPGSQSACGPQDQQRDERIMAVQAGVDALATRHGAALGLVQALPEPSDWSDAAYRGAGFKWIAALDYLSRPLTTADRGPAPGTGPIQCPEGEWPAGIVVSPIADPTPGTRDSEDLLEALEVSYRDTKDCPGLVGLRSVEDILDSHRAVGRLDPRLWWIVRAEGRVAGCMLLTPCPSDNAVELVYVGLAPELRGRGLARPLLRAAIGTSARTGLAELRCGVDRANTPAMRIYASAGFARTAQRVAWVRPVSH